MQILYVWAGIEANYLVIYSYVLQIFVVKCSRQFTPPRFHNVAAGKFSYFVYIDTEKKFWSDIDANVKVYDKTGALTL